MPDTVLGTLHGFIPLVLLTTHEAEAILEMVNLRHREI